ncbi:MAG: hypothetical protein ABS69_10990 [Nitrosomonadales bacterium SCN 54-20]|nr:MAG: hypothetical protein ABS69_10990 [Nitrosomonadales bacterium SCN 54-20]
MPLRTKKVKRELTYLHYWYLLKTMESAIFGLVGVALGGLLTLAREWWFQRRQEAKDAGFLVILVSRQLDLYVSHCASVVADDGAPGMGNYYQPKTSTPRFKLELLEVEWKSLPVGLMYKIFDFQFWVEQAEKKSSGAFEYASPPDFEEGFEERQYQYAILGIHAHELANCLRAHVGLPPRRIPFTSCKTKNP